MTSSEDVAVGVMDEEGRRAFAGEGLASLSAQPSEALAAPGVRRGVVNLFSDLNQWLPKLLLAKDLPERYFGGPPWDYPHASSLAETARCAVMSAHRFIEAMCEEGFLEAERRRLQIVRRAELLRRCQVALDDLFAD